MIFVDTSFFVAIRNARDSHHQTALQLLEAHDGVPLVTTNHVRGETWTYLRRRMGHGSAVDFIDAVQNSPRIEVVCISEDQEQDALNWLRQHDEREYSFVDATSFLLMKSRRVRDAFAFDGDFSAVGFQELRS